MSLIRKIKIKSKSLITDSLIKFSLHINAPAITALAFALATGRVNRRGQYTALCLGRSIFTNDIEALAHFGHRINYLVLNLHYWYLIYDYCISESDRNKITESNYHNQNYGQAGKQKYYSYLSKMLPLLKKLTGLNIILTGNFGYVPQQEIARACEDQKIPYIVLHKEGLALPGSFDDYANIYKTHKFIGAKMLLYNDQIKQALLKRRVNGLSESKLQVVGIPRLDFCFTQNMGNTPNKQVVFFSFYPDDKFCYLIKDENKLRQIRDISTEFHKLVMTFAARHPEIKVIIKTKVAKHYVDYVQNILTENFNDPLSNLSIINVGEPSNLIQDSIAVIGFNSTTLIEAIISGKIIITPYLGNVITDFAWDYFGKQPELVNYATTYQQLEDYILNNQKYLGYNKDMRDKFLQQFIHTPDGQASRRTEQAIIQIIKEYLNLKS